MLPFSLTLLLAFTPAGAFAQDQSTTQKACALVEKQEHAQAIALLNSSFGSSFSAARCFFDAHLSLNKRLEFIKRTTAEADSGNPFVSYFLAIAIRDAVFFEPRAVERYLLIAFRGGIGLAAHDLGQIYFDGLQSLQMVSSPPKPGVSADLEKAREMFEACRNDRAVGQKCSIGLGHALLALRSTPKEPLAIFEDVKAFGVLWGMYYFGVGVSADKVKADDYLGRIRRGESVDDDVCSWQIQRLADGLGKEDPKALTRLAYEFASWSGRADCIPGALTHPIALLERALNAGGSEAAKVLGDAYYSGKRVRKDPVLAFYYYSVLNVIGDTDQRQHAASRLDTLEKLMSPADLSEARSLFRKWKKSPAGE